MLWRSTRRTQNLASASIPRTTNPPASRSAGFFVCTPNSGSQDQHSSDESDLLNGRQPNPARAKGWVEFEWQRG